MSSRMGLSIHSHHDSKQSSGSRSALESKQQNKSSGSPPPSHKPRQQSSSSTKLKGSDSARASTKPSNATPVPDSASDTSQILYTGMYDLSAHRQVELLEVSAWAYPHQSSGQYQETLYQSYDSTQTSTCLYHASWMGSNHNLVWSGSGLGPLKRWLDEDMGDGGMVALQFGQQLRVDCTCFAMQGGVSMIAVNGTQHGVTSEN